MKRIVLALFAFAAFSMFTASAQAHGFGYGYYGGYYHAPSVHYHTTYHPTSIHWTPYSGWHTHGHYDVTPHYTPGHFHW